MNSFLSSLTGLMSALLIPVIAIVGGISFAAFSLYLKARRQRETLQMYHAERMAAIEKGIELPPLPPGLLYDGDLGASYRGDHRRWRQGRGLTLIFVGAAITVAMWQANGDNSFWWGLVIVAWGLGRLLSEYVQTPGPPPQAGNGPTPPGPTLNR